MSLTHNISISFSRSGSDSITKEIVTTPTNPVEINSEVELAANQTDSELNVDIDVSAVQSLWMMSTEDLLLEINTNSGTDINLAANVPVVWTPDMSYTNPLGGVDITSLFLTNTTACTFYLRVLMGT